MMMKVVSLIQLLILTAMLGLVVTAQPVSIKDAVQDMKILSVEAKIDSINLKLDALWDANNRLTASMNEGFGIGKGFLLALTILQLFQTLGAWRFRKSDRPSNAG